MYYKWYHIPLTTEHGRQEDRNFKVIFGYIEFKTNLATWDPILDKTEKKKNIPWTI